MTWLLVGVSLLGVLLIAARWFVNANPADIVRVLRWLGILVGLALVAFLALRGLWGAIFPMLFFGLMYLRRRAQRTAFSRGPDPVGQTPAGRSSEVRTATLRMRLDHDTGDLDGEVLRGRFAGRNLTGLTERELIELLDECGNADHESAQLLETYLDRRLGPAWRDDHEGASDQAPRSQPGTMSSEEAFSALGLEPGASDSEIRDAHHRLMKRVHPDQGGSTFLATKINQAKDLLLGKS
jgi:hypothetical protein